MPTTEPIRVESSPANEMAQISSLWIAPILAVQISRSEPSVCLDAYRLSPEMHVKIPFVSDVTARHRRQQPMPN